MTVRKWVRTGLGTGLVAVAVAACSSAPQQPPAPVAATQPPSARATAVDMPTPARVNFDTLVLAGGCFWGVQGLFQHVKGVTAAESGYVGGTAQTANYDAVETGQTRHTEAVRITFDPAQVTESQLLKVFFTVVEDPTHLTRLASDVHATQYQSAIYVKDDTQRDIAKNAITQLDQAAVLGGPLVTTILPTTEFFAAERYHQDFMYRNPAEPYIASAEMPKLANLQRQFADQFREKPVLMFPDDA